MTRQEAIERLELVLANCSSNKWDEGYTCKECGMNCDEAIDMAIEALKQESSEDCINKVEGEWIEYRKPSFDGTSYIWKKCSVCDHDMIGYETNFCPNCGTKMKNGEE